MGNVLDARIQGPQKQDLILIVPADISGRSSSRRRLHCKNDLTSAQVRKGTDEKLGFASVEERP